MTSPTDLDTFRASPQTALPMKVGTLVDPQSGLPLRADSAWTLSDGHRRWPVIEGICFLREGRDALRDEVIARLDAGDSRKALALLLTDRDDFAPGIPLDEFDAFEVVNAVLGASETLRGAMKALGYGPVADYLAHRPSLPTFLSGLGLLMSHWPGPDVPIIDLGCGIGSFLKPINGCGQPSLGIDVVFSKLWLGRRFLCPDAQLLCADIVQGWPIAFSERGGPLTLFCHDAFYFLPEKQQLAATFCKLAGPDGRVLIGHAHNRQFDHRGVLGTPLDPKQYEALFPGALCYDDQELSQVPLGESALVRSPDELSQVEAIAFAWSADGDLRPIGQVPNLADPPIGSRLQLNPLLSVSERGLTIQWPTNRLQSEFEASIGYLVEGKVPSNSQGLLYWSGPDSDSELIDQVRRRVFIDLPERW